MSNASILVVDGSKAASKAMRLALQAEGHEVLEANDLAGALAAVAEQTPALVLLDCGLPDLNGFEVARRFRAVVPDVPMVALIGWARASQRATLAAGFLDMLVKPVDPARLVEVVERHVGRAPAHRHPTGTTVLLADDDPSQRKLAELAFRRAGFEVVVAADGAAALALATAHPPHVIVSDVLMPGVDGFALCRAVRANPELATVPVVLMSAHYLEAEDHELGARFGAHRYVSRTDGFDVVIRATLEALDSAAPPLPATADPGEPQAHYLHRIASQLERQASLGVGLARRVSLQASALSVLDGISDSVARQLDPEKALDETLAGCLDAAGTAVGAIFLRDASGALALKSQVSANAGLEWGLHLNVFEAAMAGDGLVVPGVLAGPAGDALLKAVGAASALIVPITARDEVLGALLLASDGTDFPGVEGEGAVRAARLVARQLGQALALSRMFAKLASAELRKRALLENAHDAISITTPEGIFLEVNRRMEQLLGVPREKALGRHVADFAAPGHQRSNAAAYDEVIAKGTGSVSAVSLAGPDGREVQVEYSSTVVTIQGERFVLSIARDISERLRLEEQLRQSQKMEAVGRLAGGIAHDFNNALSVILSYGELVLDQLAENEPLREDIQEIRKAALRAADLTRQLLTFSRQQVVESRVLDLNEVLMSLDRMLQRILGADVDLVSLPMPHLGRVRVDPGSLEQVIMNLVVNARDAMPRGGKLTIETANVELDPHYAQEHHGVQPGPYVMLAVTDTGMGMDKATQRRIFEPFFTTKPVGKGTGLGLSTVFGIVQQSGGSVWVYSEPNAGTTFKVYLPRVNDAVDVARAVEAPSNVRGTETILLVEDDDQVRAVALAILRKNGYEVLEARNAGEALMHAESHPGVIHLLLTDVVMPQVSGPELARQLGRGRPGLKVLCMSGYTDDSIVRHGVLDAHIAFLQKPITPTSLAIRVREVLDAAPGDPSNHRGRSRPTLEPRTSNEAP